MEDEFGWLKIRVLVDQVRIIAVAGQEVDPHDVPDLEAVPEGVPRGNRDQDLVQAVQNETMKLENLGPGHAEIQWIAIAPGQIRERSQQIVPVQGRIPEHLPMEGNLQRKEADLEVGHLPLNNIFLIVYITSNMNLKYEVV